MGKYSFFGKKKHLNLSRVNDWESVLVCKTPNTNILSIICYVRTVDLRERYIEIYKIENKIHITQLLHGNPKTSKTTGQQIFTIDKSTRETNY